MHQSRELIIFDYFITFIFNLGFLKVKKIVLKNKTTANDQFYANNFIKKFSRIAANKKLNLILVNDVATLSIKAEHNEN